MVNNGVSAGKVRRFCGGKWDKALKIAYRVLVYTVLCAGCVIILIPLAWMISTSLKDLRYVFVFPPQWIPDRIQWGNFEQALAILPFGLCLRNTMVIACISLVATAISSSVVAYGFARLDFPARNVLFVVMLSTLMIPVHVTLVPRYVLFNWLGLVDTFVPLVAPAFFGTPVYVFLLRQSFMTIPVEMDEAALIDGCSKWSILWRIILPQSLPALGIVAISAFLFNWNAFLGPLIYLNSPDKRTLALGLSAFQASEGGIMPAWNLLMAASLVVMLPPIFIFFVAQRFFIQGIVFSGIKG